MELVKWNKARQAITEAQSVDEVKDIRDKAEAMRAYAKQAGETLEVQNQIAEIKLRAERKAGELLKDTEKHKGGNPNLTSNIMLPVEQPTLSDLGITKMQSSRWQKIADVPEQDFEEHIEQVKAKNAELTTASTLRLAKDIARKNRPIETAPTDSELTIELVHGDFRNHNLKAESVDLILTDPPYPHEYIELWSDLSRVASDVLKPGGFCIAYSGNKYLPEVMARIGEHLEYYWIGALYHEGPTAQRFEVNMWNRFKPILIYYKPPRTKQTEWIEDVINSPAPNKQLHEWGQSVEPAVLLAKTFSKPGDLILEPMAGGGAFMLAANRAGRNVLGYEIEQDKHENIRQLLGC